MLRIYQSVARGCAWFPLHRVIPHQGGERTRARRVHIHARTQRRTYREHGRQYVRSLFLRYYSSGFYLSRVSARSWKNPRFLPSVSPRRVKLFAASPNQTFPSFPICKRAILWRYGIVIRIRMGTFEMLQVVWYFLRYFLLFLIYLQYRWLIKIRK